MTPKAQELPQGKNWKPEQKNNQPEKNKIKPAGKKTISRKKNNIKPMSDHAEGARAPAGQNTGKIKKIRPENFDFWVGQNWLHDLLTNNRGYLTDLKTSQLTEKMTCSVTEKPAQPTGQLTDAGGPRPLS